MQPETNIAVIGAGVMGSGIAQALAAAGCGVRLHDVSEDSLRGALDRIEHGTYGVRALIGEGRYGEEADAIIGRLTTTTDLDEAVAGVQLVHEAVFEDMGNKLRVFREVGSRTGEDVVIASGTSGLSIAALASQTPHPERVIGWHWCTPGPVKRMAEIAVHPGTSVRTRDFVVALAARAGKNPQVINEHPFVWGFVSTRMTVVILAEADRMVAEGVATTQQIDEILKDCMEWPAGPFEMIDKASTGWDQSNFAKQNAETMKIARLMAPATYGRALGTDRD